MILRFYSPLSVKCDTPRAVVPHELANVLDALPVKCQRYFDDIAELFDEHYLMETHEKNYSIHSVVPSPCIHNTVPYICWVVTIQVHQDSNYKPFDISNCICDIRKTLDGQITDGWGEGLNQQKIVVDYAIYRVQCEKPVRVMWPGVCSDGIVLLHCTPKLDVMHPFDILQHGWLDLDQFDYFIRDLHEWLYDKHAVKKFNKHHELLASKYDIDLLFINGAIDWYCNTMTDDIDGIKTGKKLRKKIMEILHN